MAFVLEPDLTHSIIGAFYEVYNELGYGFVESVYAAAMEQELAARHHRVSREVSLRVQYKGHIIARQRLDFIVEDRVVVELKAGSQLAPAALAQLTNYLRATELEVGLLLHFGPAPRFHRVVFTR